MVEIPVKTDEQTFSKILCILVESRGYETQTAFALALEMKYSTPVSRWYRGSAIPSIDNMSKIRTKLMLSDQELKQLNDSRQEQVVLGRGQRGKISGSPQALKNGIEQLKPSNDPFDLWLEAFCQQRMITQGSLANSLDFIHDIHGRALGLRLYYEIIDQAPKKLNLHPEQHESLVEAIAASIEKQISEGRQFGRSNNMGSRALKYQKNIACRTYIGSQAAALLGVSPSRLGQLKTEFGISSPVLTDADLELFRNRNTRRGRSKKSQL